MELSVFITRYLATVTIFLRVTLALPYLEDEADWNLNQNQTATHPLDYAGQWEGHTYHPSPENWRFPFYTIFLDRFVNGDPSNDNANGTQWEHILTSNEFRHGGDVLGLVDTFDYLQGMGIKVGSFTFLSLFLYVGNMLTISNDSRVSISLELHTSIFPGPQMDTRRWT